MSPIAHRLVRASASATLILGTLLAAPAGAALAGGPTPTASAASPVSDAVRALPRPAPALSSEAVPSVATVPAVAAPADFSNVAIGLRSVMSGLSGPVQVTNAGDGSGRLFVVEQRGVIKVWRAGHVLPTPFLDMRSKVVFNGERGLLALAFSPNYKHNHKFYVLYTERGTGDVILAEYKATSTTSNHASPGSFRRLLRVSHRVNTNHNGGMLAFGFAGLLYISIGDGGGARRRAQQRPVASYTARQDPPDRREPDLAGPRVPDPEDEPVLRRARSSGARSGRTACATRGGSRSTGEPATCGSATSARTRGRRSTTPARPAAAARASTSAGTSPRATPATTRRPAAT